VCALRTHSPRGSLSAAPGARAAAAVQQPVREPTQTSTTSKTQQRPSNDNEETAVYAIVRAGAKQQKVAVGDVIEIDTVSTGVGETVTLPVVLVVDGEAVTSDATKLDKASVTAEVLGATKGPKIVIQKYKNKTGYKKRQGHRQKYTQVKITDIKA
jgi:large subunit ribosomal protein L21